MQQYPLRQARFPSCVAFLRNILRRVRDGRCYNEETVEAIREAQAHARGEIELEAGYVPPQFSLLNKKPCNTVYEVVQTSRFRSDLDKMVARGADIRELDAVVEILANGGILPKRYRDHKLRGAFEGQREFHIRPDWLLVYSRDENALVLCEIRTGTHSDLFP